MTDKQEAELQEDCEKLLGIGDGQLSITTDELSIITSKVKFLQEYNSYLGKTKQFMTSFNQIVNEKPVKPNKDLIKLRLSLILEELTELAEACGNNILADFQRMLFTKSEEVHKLSENGREKIVYNEVEIFDAFIDLQYVLSGTIHTFGMGKQFDEGFEEVHNSNMSKLCIIEEEANETIESYLLQTPSIETYKKQMKEQGYWIILRKKDNKVLKSIYYKPAQLKEIIEKS